MGGYSSTGPLHDKQNARFISLCCAGSVHWKKKYCTVQLTIEHNKISLWHFNKVYLKKKVNSAMWQDQSFSSVAISPNHALWHIDWCLSGIATYILQKRPLVVADFCQSCLFFHAGLQNSTFLCYVDEEVGSVLWSKRKKLGRADNTSWNFSAAEVELSAQYRKLGAHWISGWIN